MDQIQIRWTDISYDKERAKIIINHPKAYETSSNCSKNEHSSETVTNMINMNSGPSKIHYDLTGHFSYLPSGCLRCQACNFLHLLLTTYFKGRFLVVV